MRIGVDVGGTNTDAVIIGAQGVIGWQKTPTTEDVYSGIVTAISAAIDSGSTDKAAIDSVMIGTTHFTNAVIERRALLPVGVLRLCLPATSAIPPMTDWPADLIGAIGGHVTLVAGGYEYDGREIAPLDEKAVAEAAGNMRKKGLQSAAVTSVFSPMNGAMEQRAAEIIRNEAPDIAVSLSSELGQFGLLPRENSTIINAALVALAARVVEAFRRALHELGLDVPLFISQNDGTLMRVEEVERYPVLTFASGPTNSMRGAAHLAGIGDAMVVDIGGTTSDIGMLRKGFPRQSTHFVDVGGVKTNFRMPDVLAIGLGGGSIISDHGCRVGPHSVGFALTQEALCFGGSTLTATDIAVAGGWADIGDRSLVKDVATDTIDKARDTMRHLLDVNVERMKTEARDLPLLAVGGGAVLIDWPVRSVSEVIRPDFSAVANAVGAAIAQVSGHVERVIAMTESNRDDVLNDARDEACSNAIRAGATPASVEVIEVEQVPISYLPGNPTRLRVTAVGDLPI
ncbi:MAG: hydantoinase/oxoprolinase family protein [Alphaproteobacteria bacterium]|nr:hydantoinase/oxoprolinase family protein [Alphaproteobacteria bacterium]